MSKYYDIAFQYANDVVSGRKKAHKLTKASCQRFLDNLQRKDIELRTHDPDFVIKMIQNFIVHRKGENLNGESLVNTPLILLPWQIFIVYNLVGFYYVGTKERVVKEAFFFIPRKNGKTLFVAALSFALAVLNCRSGSQIYIVAASKKQALESFEDIVYSIDYHQKRNEFKVKNSYVESSVSWETYDDDGTPWGSMRIEALSSNPKGHDSFNCNLAIVDELHAVSLSEYARFKEAMKAYTNKLIIGITTAGDNANSFCYQHLEYASKVSLGQIKDDSFFSFICCADKDDKGNVDYTDPLQHEIANPSYGVTIRPSDILNDSIQAQNDPQKRKDFLSRSLNIYTAAMKAYFNLDEFKASDQKYNWTIDELSRLPIQWYGGADLSKMHDLTASALFGIYGDVNICITHAFIPIVTANEKAHQDNIPFFGWEEDGWLTMCNTPTVNYSDIINWFKDMRGKGFNIVSVAFDKKFGREFFSGMKKSGFKMEDAPQYFYSKSEGFRHIEKAAKDGCFYYLHSEAYEYCVSNVHAIEVSNADDMIKYEKIEETQRIDLFDASVFACRAYLIMCENMGILESWYS